MGSNRSRDAVGYSLRQTVHTHRASVHQADKSVAALRQTVHTHRAFVHQADKSVAALLRVARVTFRQACLAESDGSLPPGL